MVKGQKFGDKIQKKYTFDYNTIFDMRIYFYFVPILQSKSQKVLSLNFHI